MSKMEIWDAVSKTDPAHTKKVNQRGGFTAIDAHYQVMEATRQFGPIGKGWGYNVEYSTLVIDEKNVFQFADVTLWWNETGDDPVRDRGHGYGPVRGCEMLVKAGRADTDATKKAMTDGITKALSHLGFNADVFLGKFDDNKYLKQREQEVKTEEFAGKVLTRLEGLATLDELDEAWEKLQPGLVSKSAQTGQVIKEMFERKRRELKEKEDGK